MKEWVHVDALKLTVRETRVLIVSRWLESSGRLVRCGSMKLFLNSWRILHWLFSYDNIRDAISLSDSKAKVAKMRNHPMECFGCCEARSPTNDNLFRLELEGRGGGRDEWGKTVGLVLLHSECEPFLPRKVWKTGHYFWVICHLQHISERKKKGGGETVPPRFQSSLIVNRSSVAWALMIHSELKLKRVPGFPLVPPWAVGRLFYLMGLLCSTACGSKVTVNGTRYRIIKGIGEGGTYERTPLLSTHRYVKKIQCVWKYTVCGYSAHDPSHRIGTVFNVLVRNTSKMRLQKFQMSHWNIGLSHLTSRCCGWINWLLDLHSSTCHYGFPNSKPELH